MVTVCETMVRIKRRAMDCEFELILCGGDERYLQDAAEEAFEEVERLEEQLSAFVPASEISYINACAGSGPVRVEPRLFRLFETAKRLSEETEGGFDVTAGTLGDLWRRSQHAPSQHDIADALAATGMSRVLLDSDECTVRFTTSGIRLNLGALGKGYAVGRVAELLKDRGVTAALIHAGASTVYALGTPPGEEAWTVGIRHPVNRSERITSVTLKDRALSTSGSHERFVEIDGVRYSHIIDPRTGRPANGDLLMASAASDDPAESDALSTAFFLMGIERARVYCRTHSGIGAVLVRNTGDATNPEIVSLGELEVCLS
jgi:thiamine biosynthesis lipoprotein